MMPLRPKLIQLALWLQFPPCTWFFAAYYSLAVWCSRWLVSRADGVKSIYLSGAMARKNCIYGLSDIDFKVFVSGERNHLVYQSILGRFQTLQRIFPMLGSPDEKGIYFLESFASDYIHHPLVQHLFDERYFRHRLVYGEDVLPRLPIKPREEIDQGECAFGRLKDWIEKIHLLAGSDVLCRHQKQHLFFKAVCDVALLAIRIREPEFAFTRRAEILLKLLPELRGQDLRLVENLIEENRILYRRKLNSDDDNFRLFKRMVAVCCERAAGEAKTLVPFPDMEFQSPYCAPVDSSVASTLQNVSSKIQSVRGIHWPQLPLNPFDLELFSSPSYLIVCNEFLGLEEFRKLKTFYRNHVKGKAGVFLLENASFVSSVDSELLDHWGGFPESSDLLYRFLGNTTLKTLSRIERKRIGTRTSSFVEQLKAVVESPDFGRMDPSIFPIFLLNALRVLIFHNEFNRGKWQWLLTARQTTDYLMQNTPLSPAFIGKLARQYENRTNSGAHFDERLMPKCRILLRSMLGISLNGFTWESLKNLNSVADEHRVSVTAAVITADRPEQLKRCLDSVSRLSRLPEELIVVDNGRNPLTRSTVEGCRAGFPVRYQHCESPGVAGARNMAARAAKGEIIAFLDDDASVDPEWLEHIERAFLRDPKIGLASGTVLNMECGRSDSVWKFMEAVEKV